MAYVATTQTSVIRLRFPEFTVVVGKVANMEHDYIMAIAFEFTNMSPRNCLRGTHVNSSQTTQPFAMEYDMNHPQSRCNRSANTNATWEPLKLAGADHSLLT